MCTRHKLSHSKQYRHADCVVVLTDVEVESICTGAAIVVCIVICICAALSVVDIVPCI